jgi:two-component system, NarL family, nitrate/nitrite response regulator NarL
MTRILIVDDQPSFRRQLRALLERAGLEVVAEAGSIGEAQRLAQSLQPELAVVDVLLPGLSGIEGTPRLKSLVPGMRVILISAYHDRLLPASAKAAGAEAFIPKDELDLSVALSWKRHEEKQDET